MIAVLIIGGIFILGRNAEMTNIAETKPDHAEAQLKTRNYKADLTTVKKAAEEAIPTLKTWGGTWKLIETKQPSADTATIVVEVPVVIFTDDLKIEMKSDGNQTVVNMRSASRVGKSDLGENRRHLLQILEVLDAKFAK